MYEAPFVTKRQLTNICSRNQIYIVRIIIASNDRYMYQDTAIYQDAAV